MPLTRIKLTAIADGGISTAKLADNSVTIDKLNNNLALGGNDTGGTPFTITLPNNSVTTDVVNNDAITIAKLSDSLDLSAFSITLPQGVGGTNWTNGVKNTDFNAETSNGYFIDLSGSGQQSITVTLPSSPSAGNYVSLVDYKGAASLTAQDSGTGTFTNRIIINAGTVPIEGVVGLRDIGSPKGGAQLVYVDSTQGWVVTDAANEGTAKALIPSTVTITSILNNLGLSYFQSASDVLTITGTNFVSGSTVTLIDQIGSSETTATITNAAGNSTPTFGDSDFNSTTIKIKVDQAAVTAGQSAGEDPFSVKVTGTGSNFATLSNALNYSVAPTFNASPAADANLATVTTSAQAGTSGSNAISSFANISTTITAGVLTPKDPDDTITYAITTLPTELTGLTINSTTGALGGTTPSNGYGAAGASTDYTFTVTSTATPTESGFESQTKTNTRNFAIKLEGTVTAPTVTAVELGSAGSGNNYIGSNASSNIIVTGTGFKRIGGVNPTITFIPPSGSSASNVVILHGDVTFNSATELQFQSSAALRSMFTGILSTTGDERADVKVINPAGNGSYLSESSVLTNALEYFDTPTFTQAASADISGTSSLTPSTGQSYAGLTSLTITKSDPEDTIALSIGNNGGLTGLGITATDNGSTVTGAFTGTGDLSSVATGTKTVTVNVTATSDYDGKQLSDNRSFNVTVGSASSGPGYTSNIQNSLLFGSGHLERTLSSSALTAATISMWIKGIGVGSDYLFVTNKSSTTASGINWYQDADGRFYMYVDTTSDSGTAVYSAERFRDYSSWYHLVLQSDSSNNAKFWINNVAVTSNGSTVATIGNFVFQTKLIIGTYNDTAATSFPGYMANIHFIDGHALSPDYFAETDTATGSWIPKDYDGTSSTGGTAVTGSTDDKYGTYGFHVDFRASSLVYSGLTLSGVNDVSGRSISNDLTAH